MKKEESYTEKKNWTQEMLLEGCRKFDASAQEALYQKYAPLMKGICIRFIGDREDSKDVFQDGFVKILISIGQFSGTGSLEGWMRRVMTNTILAYFKKNKKLKHESLEDLSDHQYPAAEEKAQEEDLVVRVLDTGFSEEQLLKALDSLPDSFRIVFNLFYLENLSHKEISGMLSIDEKTSRTRLYRAKILLRDIITEKINNEESLNTTFKLTR